MKRERIKVAALTGRGMRIGLLLAAMGFLVSCATKPDVFKEIDEDVQNHNFKRGLEAISRGQEGKKPLYPEKNAVSLLLDKGFLEHYDENFVNSSNDLQEAERLMSEAFTKSVSDSFMTYIANDNSKEYAGEDFEDIYINVFNSLNYYSQGNIEGALVEIRKLTLSSGKLDMLSRKYENARTGFGEGIMKLLSQFGLSLNDALPTGVDSASFTDSALARYLSVLFYLADGNEDSARIELDALNAAFESNRKVYYHPIPKAVAEIQDVPEGQARLHVIGFSGLSPIKQEGTFSGHFIFFQNPELKEPVFNLLILVDRPNVINQIEVIVDGHDGFNLELIEDMGAVVKETFNARFADIFFKTYLRVLGKYIAVEAAATAAGNSKGGSLARGAAAVSGRATADATEKADIRMGRFLPNSAYVGGINLDPGTYNIKVNFYSGSQQIAQDTHNNVNVGATGLNLLQIINLK